MRCSSASHHPDKHNQMTLPTSAPAPASGSSTMVRPNGHSAYDAMRSEAIPNGIVMIRMKHTSAASSIAKRQP